MGTGVPLWSHPFLGCDVSVTSLVGLSLLRLLCGPEVEPTFPLWIAPQGVCKMHYNTTIMYKCTKGTTICHFTCANNSPYPFYGVLSLCLHLNFARQRPSFSLNPDADLLLCHYTTFFSVLLLFIFSNLLLLLIYYFSVPLQGLACL